VDKPLAKSGGRIGHIDGDYRHEFGSLRKFIDCNAAKCNAEIFDLAAHLIAAHHGRGRPHFPKGGFDPDASNKSPEIGVEVMRRFGRLQRQYGYWRLAWLENLLRCADALASAENDGGLRK
jgi:CRISPR-associated endonuclease/helicase Cas3